MKNLKKFKSMLRRAHQFTQQRDVKVQDVAKSSSKSNGDTDLPKVCRAQEGASAQWQRAPAEYNPLRSASGGHPWHLMPLEPTLYIDLNKQKEIYIIYIYIYILIVYNNTYTYICT